MSTTLHRFSTTARARLRRRRDTRVFVRAYEQASPSMQSELLVMSQRQQFGH